MRTLPPRLHLKHGAYFYVTPPPRRWIRLSTDLREALRQWARIEADGAPRSQSSVVTFSDVMERYLREVMPSKSKNTQYTQKYQAARLTDVFGKMPVGAITGTHIGQYLDQHTKPVSANREIALLSHVLTKAIRWGYLISNPALGVEKHRERARTRYVTDAELRRLLAASNPATQTAILLAYYTAQREGDVLGLCWSHVQEGHLRFVQQKTQVVVKVVIDDAIQSVLDAVKRSDSDYIILNRFGQPYSVQSFSRSFAAFRTAAGLPDVHFHDIRAKAATDMELGASNRADIQALLGHKTAAMTERYIKARKERSVNPVGRKISRV